MKNEEETVDEIFDELDEDLLLVLACRRGIRNIIPKSKVWCCNVLTMMDDGRFRQMLRVDRNEFARLIDLISSDLEFKKPHASEQFPIEIQLAIVLYRLGSSGENASFRKIATIFGVGDGGTIVKITRRIFQVILNLQSKYISWPDKKERRDIVSGTYHELPFCIGYIDGTEIKLAESPVKNHASYFSKNRVYSIKTQVVCDYKLKIRHVVVGHLGSSHDARMFRTSSIFKEQEKLFSSEQWIAGDSAYPLSKIIITPYRSNSQHLDKAKRKAFNLRHSRYRVRIEHCFGILKEKFGSLKELRIRIHNEESHKFCCDWFLVCCILHNILRSDSDQEYMNSLALEQNQDEDTDPNGSERIEKHYEIKRQALYSLMFQ